jgi:Sigma-70, region 4
MGMGTKALSVTPVSFEKVFAAPATRRLLAQNWPSGKIAKDLTGWRAMAWEALRRKKLGDTLRRAIGALSAKYREVLFLQDVKNLDTGETAWVLDMTAEAVRSRLLKARTQVRNALSSALRPKPRRTPAVVIPARVSLPAIFRSQRIRIRFRSRKRKRMSP